MIMENKVKPITPQEAKAAYGANIPDLVFEAINGIIAVKGRHGGSFSIMKAEAVKAIVARYKEAGSHIERQDIFDNNYLDFEKHYEAAGWKVVWNKIHYSESGDDYFSFSPKG